MCWYPPVVVASRAALASLAAEASLVAVASLAVAAWLVHQAEQDRAPDYWDFPGNRDYRWYRESPDYLSRWEIRECPSYWENPDWDWAPQGWRAWPDLPVCWERLAFPAAAWSPAAGPESNRQHK